MAITHHPSDAELARFAAGSLGGGRSVLLQTHLALCPKCRRTVHGFEELGAVFLEDLNPVVASSVRAAEILKAAEPPRAAATEPAPDMPGLPRSLAGYDLGPWRWAGPGLHWRAVHLPRPDSTRVFLLRSAAGKPLPKHRHTGIEWTCVIEGAFHHDLGQFGPGDFDEADEGVEHTPIVDASGPCLCVVAMEGDIMLQGFIGRLVQPFVRF